MKLIDVKPGMKLINSFTSGDKTPVTVTRIIDNGFAYKYDENVHLGARYGYISKDSECEAYAINEEVFYEPFETQKQFILTVIEYEDMKDVMLKSELMYGTPTSIAFDNSGRAYVWPIPFRLKRE